jgi:Subtilase family
MTHFDSPITNVGYGEWSTSAEVSNQVYESIQVPPDELVHLFSRLVFDADWCNRQHDWRGQGVRIAIIDHGFDVDAPEFASRHSASSVLPIQTGRHGAVVGKVVATLAPKAELLFLDGHIRSGVQGNWLDRSHIASQVDRAVELGATMINLSLRFQSNPPPAQPEQLDFERFLFDRDYVTWTIEATRKNEFGAGCQVDKCALCRAVDNARAHGVLIVAAAGNRYAEGCPGKNPSVLSVGSVRPTTGEQSYLQQFMATPQTALGFDAAIEPPDDRFQTSFLTPMLTGVLSCIPGMNVGEVFAACDVFRANGALNFRQKIFDIDALKRYLGNVVDLTELKLDDRESEFDFLTEQYDLLATCLGSHAPSLEHVNCPLCALFVTDSLACGKANFSLKRMEFDRALELFDLALCAVPINLTAVGAAYLCSTFLRLLAEYGELPDEDPVKWAEESDRRWKIYKEVTALIGRNVDAELADGVTTISEKLKAKHD